MSDPTEPCPPASGEGAPTVSATSPACARRSAGAELAGGLSEPVLP